MKIRNLNILDKFMYFSDNVLEHAEAKDRGRNIMRKEPT